MPLKEILNSLFRGISGERWEISKRSLNKNGVFLLYPPNCVKIIIELRIRGGGNLKSLDSSIIISTHFCRYEKKMTLLFKLLSNISQCSRDIPRKRKFCISFKGWFHPPKPYCSTNKKWVWLTYKPLCLRTKLPINCFLLSGVGSVEYQCFDSGDK